MIATPAFRQYDLDTDDGVNEITLNLKPQNWKFPYLIFFPFLFSWSDCKSGLSRRTEQVDLYSFTFSKDK